MAALPTASYAGALSRLSEATAVSFQAARADCEEEEESYIEACLGKSTTGIVETEDPLLGGEDEGYNLEQMRQNLRTASQNVVSTGTLAEYRRCEFQLCRIERVLII